MKNSGLRMSKKLACIVLLISGINCFAQTFAESMVSVLKKRDLTEAKIFLANSKHMDVHPVLYRQILGDYFEYSYEARNSPGYKICFFTNGDKIIYTKFLERNKKKFEEMDSISVKLFYKSYTAFFQNKIKLAHFFGDTTQYGKGCGFVGVDPPLRKKLNNLIKTKNTKELTKWLQSPITEKQLYGVEGIMELEKKAYKPTEFQKKLISFIKTKKGEAKTCNGCIYSNMEINKVFEVKK